MSSAVAKISKPVMKGMHIQTIKKNLILATGCAMVTSTAWYFGVVKSRRDNYAKFYKNYDHEADYQRMVKAGVFQATERIAEFEASQGSE